MEQITIREHTTNDIMMIVSKNDQPIDLGGVDHVRLDIIDKNGKTSNFPSVDGNGSPASPSVVITDAVAGEISFTPPDENFFKYQNTPYQVYIWVYETSTKKYSVPETGFAQINLEKEY